VGRASPAVAAFDAGEFSPQMEGRIDIEKYPRAAHIQQNFIALKQGPSTYRQGTAYVQPVKNSANRTWLRKFEFSTTQAYQIEFGDGYVRFYVNHGPLLSQGNPAYNNAASYVLGNQVVSGGITYYCLGPTTGNAPPNATFWYPMASYTGTGGGAIYEIPSPYAAADLTNALGYCNLDIKQQGDVLYICLGSAGGGPNGVGYPVYTLTRYANAPPNWQFAQYAPTDGPYSPGLPILPNQGIALGVSAVSGKGITITAFGGNVFAPTDVGRLVRIATQLYAVTPWQTAESFTSGTYCSNNGNNYVALNTATTGGSGPIHTSGAVLDGPTGVRWLYTDSNYGVARITGYTNAATVTADVLTTFPQSVIVAGPSAITAATQANPCVVTAANTFPVGAPLFIYGVVGMGQLNQNIYVDQVQSASTVTLAGVNSTNYTAYASGGFVVSGVSLEWQLGAWSNTTEWPRALALYKDRLFLAGKLSIWGSVPGQYNSHAPDFFGLQTTASAINVIVQGLDASNICWLSDNIILLIGTEGGEYGLDAANYSTSALGPANVEILPQSQWRCRDVHPEKVGVSLLYVQRAGRKVFAADYNFYLNRYDSTDQSKFSYHITIGGINAIAYQQEPWSLLWAARADGTLLSYTFNREDNVTAWCRHNLGNSGLVESVSVTPAPDGLRDELWMIVNRTVNGQVIRTVEYMVKPYEGPQAGYIGDSQASCWYVDCGVQYVAPPPPSGGAISNIGVTFGGHTTTMVITAPNNLSAGNAFVVSGVAYSGTFNPNGSWIATSATPTGVTVIQPGFGAGSFAYVSGGVLSPSNPSAGTTVITGLPAVMWNQTVSILADGSVQPQQVVPTGGTITLQGTFALVTIGFPYQGNLVPMRLEAGADVGTSQGKIKQGTHLVVRLVDSGGGTVGQLSSQDATAQVYSNPLGLLQQTLVNQEQIQYNYTTTALDSPPPLMSGDFPTSFPSQPSSDTDQSDFYILVQQSQPLPMTVVGLFPSYKVEEPQ
jgi:hypothetical protein